MQIATFLAQYTGRTVDALFNAPRGRLVDPHVDLAGEWSFPGWDATVLGKEAPTSAQVIAALAAPLAAEELSAYAKAKRDATEAAGITVNGVAIASDPDSQTRVANAYNGMLVAGVTSIRFKATSGFIVLSLDQVKAVGTALFDHTQACFDAEDQVDAGLAASPPTITTTAQVDAIFAAIASAY